MTTDTEALSCRELVELVTDYLDGALGPVDLARFEQHLAGCGKCAEYLAQLRQTIHITGTLTPDDLSAEMEEALLQAFRDWRRR
jgi:anti-sigma factor RsiW